MTAILVTGASGFVGAAVARRLLARGHKVRVLARASSNRRNLDGLAVEVVVGDLMNPDSLTAALAGISGLYHVAAEYRLWTRNPEALIRANVEGTRNILVAAHRAGVPRIVYTSSVAVLGRAGQGIPADEETPVSRDDMIGAYKLSKYLAEEEARRLVREIGVPAVIVNPSMPVGPGDVKPTPSGRLILEAAAGRMPAFVDTGLNVVHVDDVAEGHLLAFERGVVGERYVLGGENLTLRAILAEVARLAGRRPPRIRLPHGLVLPIAYAAEAWTRLAGGDEPFVTVDGVKMSRKTMFFSSAKAERLLGYRSRPASEAFADAITWFRREGYLS